jgi:uncharacterized protein YecE (DUF72 family)
VRVLVGTSGYSYKEWKNSFYPASIKAEAMLAYYAERLSAVEINNTFYRMPTRKMLADWSARVPETFTFVLKAPQRITHQKKLKDVADIVETFVATAQELGRKLGPMLFQLPPYFQKDIDTLRSFLDNLVRLPGVPRVAFEFRHPSWLSEDVYDALSARGAALCLAESDDTAASDDLTAPLISTADWGYLRLRRTDYADAQLANWVARLRAQSWSTVYVFLKHEQEGKGPKFAMKLRSLLTTAQGQAPQPG